MFLAPSKATPTGIARQQKAHARRVGVATSSEHIIGRPYSRSPPLVFALVRAPKLEPIPSGLDVPCPVGPWPRAHPPYSLVFTACV